ncbi:MAG: TetR/AcrR family transcriptional regulator [Bdellovibrionia bacterium]
MSKGISTKTQILDQAVRMASMTGLEGLSFGGLAKAVGMSKSGLYAHFQAKDDLQLSVLKSASETFTETVLKPAFEKPRGEPRLIAMFENWMAHLNGNDTLPGGSVFIAASIELDDRPGRVRDFVQSQQQRLIQTLKECAKMAVDEGHFRSDLDTEQFAWTMYCFVLGYHHFKRMLNDPKAEEHLRNSFESLVRISRNKGLKPKA